jgi:hypothetical protein
MCGGEGFPLHVEDRAKSWNCEGKAKVEGAAAGAEADGGEITPHGM